MTAQWFIQGCQVVAMFRCADRHVFGRDHNDVANTVRGQLKAFHGLGLVHHFQKFRAGTQAGDDIAQIGAFWQISSAKSAKRTVMYNVRIGDRQDYAGSGHTQPFVQQVLNIDNLRVAVCVMFGFHAVISGHDNCGPHCIQLGQISVEHFIKALCLGLFRGVFMLHEVGCGQIHYIRFPFGQKFNACCKNKF